jgi:hypothetical protein
MDGAVLVSMEMGNGPFGILWASGDTTFEVTDLAAGWHVFGISDPQGCQEMDSVFVPADSSVGVTMAPGEAHCGIRYNATLNELVLAPFCSAQRVDLMDPSGRILWTGSAIKGQSSIAMPHFEPGLHVVHSSSLDGTVCTMKFITH